MKKNMLDKINEVFANNEEIAIALHIRIAEGSDYCDYFEFGFDEYDSKVFEEEYSFNKYIVTSVKEDIENNTYHIWGIQNKQS